MRILFFSNVFPNPLQPTKGPFNLAMVRALSCDHEVHVVSPVSWLDEFRGWWNRRPGIPFGQPVDSAGYSVEFARYYYLPRVLRSCYGEFLEWSVRTALDRRIAQFRPDAIVSYWVHPDGDVAVRAAHRAGIPAIVMTGGSDVLVYGRQGARRSQILRVLHEADSVVTVSRNLAEVLATDGIDRSKLHVIPRGVDRDVFSPGNRDAARLRLGLPPGRRTVIAVGRLVPVKGFDVLIRAIGRLNQSGFPVDCHILGGGELRDKLTAEIAQQNLSDQVFLHGAINQADLPDWYRAADLTVLSSLSEGIPNVLLESISCGTPFVATNVGGVSEIADASLHRLVPAGSYADLALAIHDSFKSSNAKKRDGHAPAFQPLSWNESANQLAAVIESCRTACGRPDASVVPVTESGELLEVAG